MAASAGGSGSYSLSSTGSLSAANEYIGNYGSGTFTQSGGTNTVTGNLYVGNASGSSGTYNLSGGSLSAYVEAIGVYGSGSFTQSGGTHTVDDGTGNGELWMGAQGGSGAYSLSGGSLAVNGAEYLGTDGGIGTFTQSGGTHTVSGFLFLGTYGGTGIYSLSGGSLAVSGFEYLANGTFTQTGGSHTAQLIILGAGSTGTYNLSGGSLQASGGESIGDGGLGIFNQSGGANIVSGLSLGTDAYTGTAGTGTYTLSGGSLQSYYGEYIGVDGGRGTFTQSGGSNTITGDLYLGENGGTGTYGLSGGSVTAANEYVGYSGSGTFTQTGGTNAVTGNLYVGNGTGIGTYALLGGSATVGGNYTQGANGTFAVGIASPANFEKLLVGGLASLNGTLAPVLLGGYIPANNQLFPGVITASGGVTGAFSSVANPTPILSWQVIDPAGTVDLLAKRNYAGAGLNLTHNQANVGNMLNGVQATATGDLANVLNTIAALPSNGAVANAYQQISPDKAAALSSLAFAGANLQKSTLSRRITDLRFGPEDAGLTAGGLGSFSLNYAQGEGLMVASSASSLTGLLSGQQDPGATGEALGRLFRPGPDPRGPGVHGGPDRLRFYHGRLHRRGGATGCSRICCWG